MLGNHLFGIYEKALNPMDDWDTRFRKIRKLGFDFMEMSIDVTDERLARLDYSDAQLLLVAESARAEGVGIRSMCLSANRRFPIGSADEQTRRRGLEIIKKAIHVSSVMGIRVILISAYDVYGEPSTPESRQRFRDGLKWAASLAANTVGPNYRQIEVH